MSEVVLETNLLTTTKQLSVTGAATLSAKAKIQEVKMFQNTSLTESQGVGASTLKDTLTGQGDATLAQLGFNGKASLKSTLNVSKSALIDGGNFILYFICK